MLFRVSTETKKSRLTSTIQTIKEGDETDYSFLSGNSDNRSDEESSEEKDNPDVLVPRATFSNPRFLEDGTTPGLQTEDEEDWL